MGAGKSTALDALANLGCSVLSADAVVHEVQSHHDVIEAVSDRFGPQVAPGGTIDRALLAAAAFATDGGREWLEELIWPLVGRRIAEWRVEQAESVERPRAAVVEVPLLFESGMEAVFDATIAVVAGDEIRRSRAGSRGHTAVAEREARQLSQEEKASRATVTVSNDGSLEDLRASLSSALATIGA